MNVKLYKDISNYYNILMVLEICAGVSSKSKTGVCKFFAIDRSKYCEHHEYFNEFTEQQLKDIYDKKAKVCNCGRWYFEELNYCKRCLLKKNNKPIKDKPIAKTFKINKIICKGRQENGEPCTKKVIKDLICCKTHIYMKDYTQYQIDNMTRCSTCRKYKYLVNRNTCGCQTERRHNKKERDEQIIDAQPIIRPITKKVMVNDHILEDNLDVDNFAPNPNKAIVFGSTLEDNLDINNSTPKTINLINNKQINTINVDPILEPTPPNVDIEKQKIREQTRYRVAKHRGKVDDDGNILTKPKLSAEEQKARTKELTRLRVQRLRERKRNQ